MLLAMLGKTHLVSAGAMPIGRLLRPPKTVMAQLLLPQWLLLQHRALRQPLHPLLLLKHLPLLK